MSKSVKKELFKKNLEKELDIDLHDFYSFVRNGSTDEEISAELNISKSFVKRLRKEVSDDWWY